MFVCGTEGRGGDERSAEKERGEGERRRREEKERVRVETDTKQSHTEQAGVSTRVLQLTSSEALGLFCLYNRAFCLYNWSLLPL